MEIALASEAYQASLEHYRAARDEPFCSDEMLEQLAEDLGRAHTELELAFLGRELENWGGDVA
jgi:hypothetical protein